MSAKQEILQRVRAALADVPVSTPEEDVPNAWVYGQPADLPGEVMDEFAERARATERRVR